MTVVLGALTIKKHHFIKENVQILLQNKNKRFYAIENNSFSTKH